MKISLALLILLLAAAWTGSQGMSFRRSRANCCSKGMFSHRKIPEFRIRGYLQTAPTCTHRAVLVKLPKGMVCVDPEEKWLQEYLRKQKEPNSTTT
ncbi:C-C motif chemokine 13-like [Onychostruthus taczanowskii]|uniref:C-C motif chemokine 13-like n=1 Tax=Onychostruthus taczanowskii TaxID=356909 RepID=UPI001B8036D8|nr:C-C motif chemokine 13-like [Onychostruthus taczanowskii]